jgi:transcriptional regulator with XRE-family HTH domain
MGQGMMNIIRLEGGMDFEAKEKLAGAGDTSPEAIHRRLVAIRKITGLTGKNIAEAAGIKYTTYHAQEKAGSPSVRLMTYYLKAFQVDYNFILGGDLSRLPADIQQAIVAELS